ncbi:MAG: TMEM165/GDT1 family protein [Wenzhouxiangellaceae bacterium]
MAPFWAPTRKFGNRCESAQMIKDFALTLLAVGLAELGDKTQLLLLWLAAHYRKPGAILGGLVCGAALNSGLAIAAGVLIGELLPREAMGLVAGLMFVAIGLWMMIGKESSEEEAIDASGRSAFLATLSLFVIMELGDKTQLATIALAAGLTHPLAVLAGASGALVLVNLPAIWIGHRYAARLPRRLMAIGGAVVFIMLGIALLSRPLFAGGSTM